MEALLSRLDSPTIRYLEHFEAKADEVLASACRMSLEGIVSKRLDAAYVSGRSGGWTKAKCRAGHEVVVGGYTEREGALRSLLVGVNRGDHPGVCRTRGYRLWPGRWSKPHCSRRACKP